MFQFFYSNVPDNKCHSGMLFFTHIKLVSRVMACTYAIPRIKWRRLQQESSLHFYQFSCMSVFFLSLPVMSVYLLHRYPIFANFQQNWRNIYKYIHNNLEKPFFECSQTNLCFLNMFFTNRNQGPLTRSFFIR